MKTYKSTNDVKAAKLKPGTVVRVGPAEIMVSPRGCNTLFDMNYCPHEDGECEHCKGKFYCQHELGEEACSG